jgi:hypothetical protein
MIKKKTEYANQYCDYPTYKMLMEIGFDVMDGEKSQSIPNAPDKPIEWYLAPTWLVVKEWLWEKNKIHLVSTTAKNNLQFYCYAMKVDTAISSGEVANSEEFNSPITAEIEGIKKAVEYLYEEHHKTKNL